MLMALTITMMSKAKAKSVDKRQKHGRLTSTHVPVSRLHIMTDWSQEEPFPPPMTNICLPMDAAAPYPLSKGIGSAVSQEPLLGVYTSTASSQLTPSLPPVKYSCCPCNPCTASPTGYYMYIYFFIYIYTLKFYIFIYLYIYFFY